MSVEPKPTEYRGTTYRSRLEARWAVYLDYNPLVRNWIPEPQTYRLPNRWEYSPDFYLALGYWEPFLEIKPAEPSEDYLKNMVEFLPVLERPLALAFGSFYENNIQILHIPEGIHTPLDGSVLWNKEAFETARGFRFDLAEAESTPPHKSGTLHNIRSKMSEWVKDQRRKK